MVMVSTEKEHVDALKRTYELVGPIYNVVLDQNGKVLSGSHRLATKLPWPTQTKEVKSELEALLYRLLSNVQRQPKEEETKYLLNKIAEEVSKEKQIPASETCAELVRMFCPDIYTERRIEQLLDGRWKSKTGPKKIETVSIPDALEKDIEGSVKATKTALDDLSVTAYGEPHYPFPECACAKCQHKQDCY
jgi:hypothetical protein